MQEDRSGEKRQVVVEGKPVINISAHDSRDEMSSAPGSRARALAS